MAVPNSELRAQARLRRLALSRWEGEGGAVASRPTAGSAGSAPSGPARPSSSSTGASTASGAPAGCGEPPAAPAGARIAARSGS